jgi:hypothetical protein
LQSQNLPLINTDDTDQEKPKPLKCGGTEEAEKARSLTMCVRDFMRPYRFGKGVKRHLGGLAVAHQYQATAGQQRLLDCRHVAFCHAVKHCRDGDQDSLLVGRRGVERVDEKAGGCCCGKKKSDVSDERVSWLVIVNPDVMPKVLSLNGSVTQITYRFLGS